MGVPKFFVTVSLEGPPSLHDRLRGRPGAFDAMVETVVHQKAEAEEARRILDDAIHSLSEAVVLYDADERFVFCNRRCVELFEAIQSLDSVALAERLDRIAYPGLTANFDVAKTAALGITLADWKAAGRDYAREMVACARALATELHRLGIPVYAADRGFTASHQFADA